MRKPPVIYDIETYINYLEIGFYFPDTQEYKFIEVKNKAKLTDKDYELILEIVNTHTLIGFNNINFDNNIIDGILSNRVKTAYSAFKLATLLIFPSEKTVNQVASSEYRTKLRNLSRDLTRLKPFQIMNALNIKKHNFHTIDLYKIRNDGGLKFYGGIMGLSIEELPLNPEVELSSLEMDKIKSYNVNDLKVTTELYNRTIKDIEFREKLNILYNTYDNYSVWNDFRNMGDAKIGEKLISMKIEINKNNWKPFDSFKVSIAPFIRFKSPDLNKVLQEIKNLTFKLDRKKDISMPTYLKEKVIKIGDNTFNIAKGGLHSQEKNRCVIANGDNQTLHTEDVTSYYPFLIMSLGLSPRNINKEDFINLVKETFLERQLAKKEQKRLTKLARERPLTPDEVKQLEQHTIRNLIFKIMLNGGMYGKIGDVYSKYYDPQTLLSITLNGQLLLLMLIELYESNGIKVISSNTDGIEMILNGDKDREMVKRLTQSWEFMTGLNMEGEDYKALYSQSVNAYIAVYDGYFKAIGYFAPYKLGKKLQYPIVYTALRDYLTFNKPIEETIREEKNLINFCVVQLVSGGAIAINEGENVIFNKRVPKVDKNGNKVYGVIAKAKRIKIDGIDIKDYFDKHIKGSSKEKAFLNKYYWDIFDKNKLSTQYEKIDKSTFNYQDFEYAGNRVRYIYEKGSKTKLIRKASSYNVPNAHGVKVVNRDLTSYVKDNGEFLVDIDYERYISIAYKELKTLGVEV